MTRVRSRLSVAGAFTAVLMFALLSVAGCGGKDVNSAAGGGASASPRSINGQVNYSGALLGNHKIIIAVNRVGGSGPPAYSGVLTRAGPYSIANVADGSYTLLAFIDLGDDMGSPQPNEPAGVYDSNGDGAADVLVVKDGQAAIGIDIVLREGGR